PPVARAIAASRSRGSSLIASSRLGGTRAASTVPATAPADVPEMTSAVAGSQPECSRIASSAPSSQAMPVIPPAPSTTATRGSPTTNPAAGPGYHAAAVSTRPAGQQAVLQAV